MGIEFQFNRTKSHTLIIKDYCIRYVETRGKETVEIRQVQERFLPAGIIDNGRIVDIESLMIILDECVHNWKIRKKEVLLLVPDSVLFFRKISIPTNILKDEIKGYLYMEIGTSIHLPFEESIFDYHYLGKDENHQNLLLFAAQKEVVDSYVEVCEYAKLVPKVMDSSSLSLYRLYDKYLSSTEENLLIIGFDLKAVSLSFFEGTIPTYIRQFTLDTDLVKWDAVDLVGNNQLTFQFIGANKDITVEFSDALDEIQKVMSFYQYSMSKEQRKVTKIILTGDHPDLLIVEQLLKTRVGEPIELMDIKNQVKGLDKYDANSLSLNIGLSLKEVK